MAVNAARVRHTAVQIDEQLILGAAATIVPSTGTQADPYVQTAYSTAVRTTTAPVTDSTGGAAQAAAAAGVGVSTIALPINLASIVGAGDVLTAFTPGYKFKILATTFAVTVPATTADKLVTLNLEIGTTNVTGGEVALTSANCTPLGALVAGAAITAANTGAANATISVEAASVTAFSEGAGVLYIRIQNMDTADAFAGILANNITQSGLVNALIDDIQAIGLAG